MVGCQPGSLASYTPQADLDVSYDSAVNEVAVWHSGGEALDTSGRLQSISITVTRPSSGESTGYTWTEAGGEYPIETGDSVTISSPTVDGESVTEGDTIRVVLHGKWHSKPMYCPNTKHRQLVAEIVVG